MILNPGHQHLSTPGALLILPLIWTLALCLATPQFVFRSLDHHVLDLPGLSEVNFCYENWPIDHGRAYYSVFVMLVQFFVPLLTVIVSYARIVQKLKHRMPSVSKTSDEQISRADNRSRKTNILLMAIAVIFCGSWLPIHLYNIIVDFSNPFGYDSDSMIGLYAACHVLGMSSACSNPVLYGWLNDNFRKEFLELYNAVGHWSAIVRCGSKSTGTTASGSRVAALYREATPRKRRHGCQRKKGELSCKSWVEDNDKLELSRGVPVSNVDNNATNHI